MSVLILKRKNWTAFIVYMICILGFELVTVIIAKTFHLRWFGGAMDLIRFFILMPVIFSYPLLVRSELMSKLKEEMRFKDATNQYVTILTILFSMTYLLIKIIPVSVEPVFFYLLGIINLFCGFKIFSIPARQLRSIELKRNAGFWEYVSETFQFLFWPLGIWWIQPRLNKIVNKEVIIEE